MAITIWVVLMTTLFVYCLSWPVSWSFKVGMLVALTILLEKLHGHYRKWYCIKFRYRNNKHFFENGTCK